MIPIYISCVIMGFTILRLYNSLKHILKDTKKDSTIVHEDTEEHLVIVGVVSGLYIFLFAIGAFAVIMIDSPSSAQLTSHISQVTNINNIHSFFGLLFILFNIFMHSVVVHIGNHGELSRDRLIGIISTHKLT